MLQDPSIRLRNAITEGNLLIVKRLLKRFPDLLTNIDPSNGWSSLHYASYHGRYLVCVFLIQLGHDRDEILRTFKGNTSVHLALLNGHEQTTHLLLQHFPRCLNTGGHHGMTPAQVSCCHDHYQCLSLLMSIGANLTLTDDYGDTALHISLKFGSVNCTKMLVLQGDMVDDSIKNKGNWKPSDVACTFEMLKVYKKTLREAQTHGITKKPSYQSVITPILGSKGVFDNGPSPVLSVHSPSHSSNPLPPLPTISTSRRPSLNTNAGTQLRSPKTPISFTFNGNINNYSTISSPNGKYSRLPHAQNSPFSSSSSTANGESSTSLSNCRSNTVNSERNRIYEQGKGYGRWSSESNIKKSVSTVSIGSNGTTTTSTASVKKGSSSASASSLLSLQGANEDHGEPIEQQEVTSEADQEAQSVHGSIHESVHDSMVSGSADRNALIVRYLPTSNDTFNKQLLKPKKTSSKTSLLSIPIARRRNSDRTKTA